MLKTYSKNIAASITIRDLRKKVKGHSNVVWDCQNLNRNDQVDQFHQKKFSSRNDEVFKDKCLNRLIDWQKSSKLDVIAWKPGCKEEDNDLKRKKH